MPTEESTEQAQHDDQAAPPKGGVFRALAHEDFRFLLVGNLTTQIGQWVQQIAKGWLVFQLTGSPLQLGVVAFFHGAGMLVFSPIGGSLADRFDRRKVLLVSQFLMMCMAMLVAFLVLTGVVEVWQLYITAFFSSGLIAINNPTRQALVYNLVGREDLPNAIALNSVTGNSTRIIGPALGGVLISTIGIDGAFFFQAGGYVVAMMTLVKIRSAPPVIENSRTSFKESLITGVRYARRDRTIGVLILTGMVAAVFAWPFLQLMPAYTSDVLNVGERSYGFLMGAVGVGSLVGSLVVVAASGTRRKGRMLLAALLANGVLLMLLGLSSVLSLSVVILLALGFANAIHMATNQTLIQLNVEDQYRVACYPCTLWASVFSPSGVFQRERWRKSGASRRAFSFWAPCCSSLSA